MQFVRYLPLAAQRYGTLILICPAALRPPLAMLQDVAQIREAGTITAAEFDICLPLLSLPRVFGTTLVTIPAAVPYRDVAAIRRQDPTALPQLVGSAVPKVGLVWVDRPTHPHDRQRSCALWGWVRVLQTPGIAWSSLQTGDQRQELAQLPPDILIQDLAPFLHDFGDKALLLDQLDLVITVDTDHAGLALGIGGGADAVVSDYAAVSAGTRRGLGRGNAAHGPGAGRLAGDDVAGKSPEHTMTRA